MLRDVFNTICVVYLDNILIYSRNRAAHTSHVQQILARLRKAKLYANLNKCEFYTNRVGFLGFMVSKEGIQIEPERVEAIASWPRPRSIREVQVFLGFAGFYWRFIKGYSKITAALTDITKGEN